MQYTKAAEWLIHADVDSTGLVSESPTLPDSPDNTDEAEAADNPDEGSGAAGSTNTTRAPIDQQQDETIAPLPSILPTDSHHAKIEKWNLWIKHYWET
jgi:hypothetical protein